MAGKQRRPKIYCDAPRDGIWRVGWNRSPLAPLPPLPLDHADTKAGNRFDSINNKFTTLYFGSTKAACFAETLAHRRPSPTLASLVDADWAPFPRPGVIEADWRRSRVLVRAKIPARRRILDLHASGTMAWLNRELRSTLAVLGLESVTLAELTSGDRELSRTLASWLHSQTDDLDRPAFDGIRYASKHGADLTNWAIFDRTPMEPVETETIRRNDPELVRVAKMFGLTCM